MFYATCPRIQKENSYLKERKRLHHKGHMICKRLSAWAIIIMKNLREIRPTSVRLKLLITLTCCNRLFLLHPHFCSSFTSIILFPWSWSLSIITIYHFHHIFDLVIDKIGFQSLMTPSTHRAMEQIHSSQPRPLLYTQANAPYLQGTIFQCCQS